MRNIVIVNQTQSISEPQLEAVVTALQVQCDRDFGPAWSLQAQLAHVQADTGTPYPQGGAEAILLVESIDQAGALGYHELEPDGIPRGYVDAQTSGADWPATLSHELLEQLLDPLAAAGVEVKLGPAFGRDEGKLGTVSYEACDAVEDDEYAVDGVNLSNFILPAWFDPMAGGPFDFLKKLAAPLSLTAGGYIGYALRPGRWRQVTARKGLAGDKHALSRFHRRRGRTTKRRRAA